jgi:antitoxin (DNA-binding transcriptional repressor) of toxin-antitoxin stability system
VYAMLMISKSKLKAQMLQIFREIEQTGEEVIVTDSNRPVLRIQPIIQKQSVEELFAPYEGKVIFYEDPDTPTNDEWGEL